MEQRGLVRRDCDPGDRHRQRVALTPAGRSLLRVLQEVAVQSQVRLLDVLSESEREVLVVMLQRVLRASEETRLTDRKQASPRSPALGAS